MLIFCAVIRGVVWCTGIVGGIMVLYGCYDLACMFFDGRKE